MPSIPVVNPSSLNVIQPAETPTSIPPSQALTTVSPQPVACVSSRTGTGATAEVQADSLMFNRLSGPYPAPNLPLASGEEILFSNMSILEVTQVVQNPFRVRLTITLLNGEMVTDDVRDADSYWDRFAGTAKYGSFSIRLYEVKRVDFREQGGCQ